MAAAPSPRRKKRRMNSEMNVVPYIDVMLVLMVIFMVTAPLLTQGIDVELPQTAGETLPSGEEPVTVTVDRNGRLFINVGDKRDQPLSEDELLRRAGAVVRNKPEEMFLIEADGRADYQSVATAMSLLQAAGVAKIGFVTEPVDADRRGGR